MAACLRCRVVASAHPAPQNRRQQRARAAAGGVLPLAEPRATQVASAEPQRSLVPLLADLIEAQALTAAFERLAGRVACVGVASAVVCELALDPAGGVFGSPSAAASELAALGVLLLCCSVGLAARTASSPRARARLLEPVLASLTAQRRSLSGVSGADVDRALDCTVDAVFTPAFLRAHIFSRDEADRYI